MGKHMPRGLSVEAAKLYRKTVTQNALDVIDDAASMTLLENACRALDRLRAAEAVIAKEGPTIVDRFQQVKPHPMTARIDAEGQTIRQSLGAITNHQAAAAYRRGVGVSAVTVEDDPWGRGLSH